MSIIKELVSAGLLTDKQTQLLPCSNDEDSIEFVIESGLLNESNLYSYLAEKYGMMFCNMTEVISSESAKLNAHNTDKRFIISSETDTTVNIAISDPGDLLLIDKLRRKFFDRKIQWLLVSKREIKRF